MGKFKVKAYSEAELIRLFKLQRLIDEQTQKMKDWLEVSPIDFSIAEQYLFDNIFTSVVRNIAGWGEEDLKMKFISPVLFLGELRDTDRIRTFFEKTISGNVEGNYLKVQTDFMVASGVLDLPEKPYFHFQEYKPHKKPSGDSMGQLLEAMLIGQNLNKDNKPIYGCEIVGKLWTFVILEEKTYCISKGFDCTDKEDLMNIIAILRKFKHILETKLLT